MDEWKRRTSGVFVRPTLEKSSFNVEQPAINIEVPTFEESPKLPLPTPPKVSTFPPFLLFLFFWFLLFFFLLFAFSLLSPIARFQANSSYSIFLQPDFDENVANKLRTQLEKDRKRRSHIGVAPPDLIEKEDKGKDKEEKRETKYDEVEIDEPKSQEPPR